MDDVMDTTSYGKAARRKFGSVAEGFHVYSAEWIGKTPEEWSRMRVTGAQFKGKRRVPGTAMTTIVTREEMALEDGKGTAGLRADCENTAAGASEERTSVSG